MIARQKPPNLSVAQDRLKELGGDLRLEKPVPVLGKRRMVPDRIVDAQADKPAEQQIVINLPTDSRLRALHLLCCTLPKLVSNIILARVAQPSAAVMAVGDLVAEHIFCDDNFLHVCSAFAGEE